MLKQIFDFGFYELIRFFSRCWVKVVEKFENFLTIIERCFFPENHAWPRFRILALRSAIRALAMSCSMNTAFPESNFSNA
ncbi:Uncharacterised protein [Vibrio cholerae]|nr:Uncharacterised protein [Vibrio cholerae]CSB51229.1 Uncharacterised protein [Vibrio cholerae]CSD51037.1 Uncharacterised protein [Vibrio cholerae]